MGDTNLQELLATTTELVSKELNKSFEQERMLYNMFEKTKELPTNQKGHKFPLYHTPNPQIRNSVEGEAYPSGGTHKTKQWAIFFATKRIARTVTGDAADITAKNGGLLDVLPDVISMDYETFRKDLNHDLFGDGSGIKAVVATVASNPTITFADPYGARQLLEGGQYQFYNPSTSVARDAASSTIAEGSPDIPGKSAIFTATVPGTPQIGDLVTWAGSLNRATQGLKSMISDANTDFQGISRATVKNTKSPNVNASSGRLSLTLVDQQELSVGVRAGRIGQTSKHMYITNFTQLQAYRELGRQFQQFMAGQMWDGGMGGTDNKQTANGHPVYVDPDCDFDRWYFVDWSTFVRCTLSPLKIVDKDGMTWRYVPNTSGTYDDKLIIFLECKMDVGCLAPQKNSVIYGLDTTNLVSPHQG